ncbi:hypothetical protein Pcinc_013801 [Petrolisthes cinctipes]|uniref:Trichoplein keratin filament-binding protein n=1 Tax=Petrolisthes cinctipes TaxID=88211 RepID=A0AAE1KRA0_PETCI|nr:hypothetical protein Pcinc_013801 [Petrolisthes cinctipes]
MSRQRPRTAGSVRSSSAVNALRVRPGSRPGSARQWYEAYNQRRNEEAWRMEEWKNTVNFYRRRDWETQYYNVLAQPKNQSSDEEKWRENEEKKQKLAERQRRLRALLEGDEKRYQQEREERHREAKTHSLHHHFVYPEVEMLKCRLEELHRKNQEERKKMSEALAYEAWRKSNPQARQMESDRFNRFVQEAWVDQRQWKEDERRRREEIEKRKEREAIEAQQKQEEEEQMLEQERLKKQAEWKVQLEAQIQEIKKREQREDNLRSEELELERERMRLHEVSQRRERMKELRQRKDLELFWARQYQLKLKKHAADIQAELMEDEAIVEDILRGLPTQDTAEDQMKERRAETEWMKAVLGEQRRLEVLREREYDLLFSEEAEKMWRKRKAEWEKEQRARDKLMADVILGLKQQLQERSNRNKQERVLLNAEKTELQCSITSTRDKMDQLERQEEAERRRRQAGGAAALSQQPSARMVEEMTAMRRNREEEERTLEEHRKEIARLEEQMQRLWGPQYAPPRYGRKRFAW